MKINSNWQSQIIKYLILCFVPAFVLSLNSCEKEAGEGGQASISGHVWVKDYNTSFTVLESEYVGADEDVFIVYGDDKGYNDKTTTDYNGDFEFKYLRKGDYTIYIYSKDTSMTSGSGKTAVIKNISISSTKESLDLGTLTIFN